MFLANAEEFYDNMYGKIFKICPKIKSVFLIGEANHFNSRDPRVSNDARFVDNIPTGRIAPGWFPCSDYPEWVSRFLNIDTGRGEGKSFMFRLMNSPAS